MAQFAVYANPRASAERAPLLLDVQSNLVDVSSRVFAPLVRPEYFGQPMIRLNPVFELQSQRLILSPAEMTAILAKEVGAPVGDLGSRRDEIVAALDFLFTGIY